MSRNIPGPKDPNHSSFRPTARAERLVVQATGEGMLVYDKDQDQLHELNPVAMAVWNACDGRRSVEDVAEEATAAVGIAINAPVVKLAFTKLEDANLLAAPLAPELRWKAHDRRRFLKRTAAAGLAALPVIVSISAPQAAAATSHCKARDEECWNNDECCSGWCVQGDMRFAGVCR